MARYLTIRPAQEPFELGEDPQGRAMWAFNLNLWKTPSVTVQEEVAKILTTAGVAVLNVTLFLGKQARLPEDKSVSFLTLILYGGSGPEYIHNQKAPAYRRPSVHVTAHSLKTVDARALAHAAFNALADTVNETVVP